jgi:tocopherol cyclase
MIFSYLKTLYRPEYYHGHGKRKNFFEGWFFKLVDFREMNCYSIIPGIFLGKTPDKSHAFIQVMNGITGETQYHRYAVEEFKVAKDEFNFSVGNSTFSIDQISLDIDSPQQKLQGQLKFSGIKPWPVTLRSPGIMGWYSYVPFMECNHGVVSLDHTIHGNLTVNNDHIDFSGGRGYIEKDWGKSFPSSWIWIQSNHFARPGSSLTASVANIPWLFKSFRGFIIGFLHDDKLYRFATYTGARLSRLEVRDDRVLCDVINKSHSLQISAKRSKTGILYSPHSSDMQPKTIESLAAITEVRLTENKTHGVLFEGEGRHSGLDINGRLEEILDPKDVK